jgi:hypothetical protein
MRIEITSETLMLIGLLIIMFLPQIHLLLIFTVYAIVEKFGKICKRFIRFILDYILPLMCLYVLSFLKIIIFVYNDFSNLLNEI